MRLADAPAERSLTVTLRVPAGVRSDAGEIQQELVALWFHDGAVSHREACDLLGLDRRAFDTLLARHGFSPLDPLDPADEIAAAKAW